MRAIYILLLIAITSMAAGLHWASIAYFKSQEIEKASARLTLHRFGEVPKKNESKRCQTAPS